MNEIEILEKQAIDCAIALKWDSAVLLNKKILKLDKNNLGAHLRLGFAYLQTNQFDDAKKSYKSVLKVQPAHVLAVENLEKIEVLASTQGKKKIPQDLNFNPNLFLEVPGKTKTATLINPGQKTTLAQRTIGEEVFIKVKTRKIEFRTKSNEYLGSLPDDMSKRLLLFIKAGSHYSAFIKEGSLSQVIVFIKEEKKGKRVLKYSSFPKNNQSHLSKLTASDEDHREGDEEEIMESDLEHLAEMLTREDKDYLTTYQTNVEEDEENIEE